MRYSKEAIKRARLASQVNNLVSNLVQPIRVSTLFERFQQELMDIHGLSREDFEVKRYSDYSLNVKDKIFGPGISIFPEVEGSPLFYLSLGYGGAYRIQVGVQCELDCPTIEEILQEGNIRSEIIGVSTAHHFGSKCYFFRFEESGTQIYLGFTETDFSMDNWVHRSPNGEIVKTQPRRSIIGYSVDQWSVIRPKNLPKEGLEIFM
jgi:hypothetical protein